ncbi:hypothetical protein BT96DRAFT_926124 [Gymnopus androsaceus JB14]|uniref:Uncharacterized protein n=1 Tax=Gymnopus androsaceus JB14 TaxID=1447944 RepID=A0A6A4GXC6_9AGAR|nr:hypothetical protein BT96DRAFT_926124 [Gymnopus androsaceus JB14]
MERHIDASVYTKFGEASQRIFPQLRELSPSQTLISSGSLPFFEDDPRYEDFGPFLSILAREITHYSAEIDRQPTTVVIFFDVECFQRTPRFTDRWHPQTLR